MVSRKDDDLVVPSSWWTDAANRLDLWEATVGGGLQAGTIRPRIKRPVRLEVVRSVLVGPDGRPLVATP